MQSISKMMKKVFQVAEFIKYLIGAKHWRGHGVHSPFMYDFVRNTLMKAHKQPNSRLYERAFNKIAPKYIEQSTFGAKCKSGCITSNTQFRKISITPKYGKLLNNIVKNYQPRHILELGSGLGVSSFYLAYQNLKTQIVSVEGMSSYASISSKCMEALDIKNVSIKTCSFEDYLNCLDKELFDLVFIDGSHSYSSTISYVDGIMRHTSSNAFIIIDDIRWSAEMQLAWNKIKEHSKVRVSVDLGRMGMLFLNPELQKEEYVIRY